MGAYEFMDLYPAKADFDLLGNNAGALAINTEYVLFDTTRVPDGQVQQILAAHTRRRSCPHLKRAWLGIVTDQALSLYLRHLSVLVANPNDSSWDNVQDSTGASPTAISANSSGGSINPVALHFFGDDHRIILKTGAVAPTVLRVSLRFSVDQAMAE